MRLVCWLERFVKFVRVHVLWQPGSHYSLQQLRRKRQAAGRAVVLQNACIQARLLFISDIPIVPDLAGVGVFWWLPTSPNPLFTFLFLCLRFRKWKWLGESLEYANCWAPPIDSRQFGSINQSSTVHALVEMTHSWLKALDTPGNKVQILLLDFSKAFDRVDHTILLNRMSALGMPGFLVQWLTAFPTDRRLRVKMGNIESEWSRVNAGVPHGGHTPGTNTVLVPH